MKLKNGWHDSRAKQTYQQCQSGLHQKIISRIIAAGAHRLLPRRRTTATYTVGQALIVLPGTWARLKPDQPSEPSQRQPKRRYPSMSTHHWLAQAPYGNGRLHRIDRWKTNPRDHFEFRG